MNERDFEQKILVQFGTMTSELSHLRAAVDGLKSELQRLRESQVTRSEHTALDLRVKNLEAMELQFVEFKATVRTAMGLGGSGAIAGLVGTLMHFLG